MKIYLSGPITDDPDYMQHFEYYAKKLKAKGHTILDPTIWSKEQLRLKYDEFMHIDLAMLEVADAIFMLPGWSASRGAKTEQAHAVKCGKKILYSDNCNL